MSTRIILVRAVNVGGATLPMAQFRAMLTELGATEVRTYIASGNAVVDLEGDPVAFDRAVEAAIHDRFGFSREVLSRTPAQLRESLAAHPFEVVDAARSYIAFLSATPESNTVDAAADLPTGPDRWALSGRELHLCFADGMGRATLNLDRLLKTLGVAGTARNLRTVQALIDLADR